ncbi:MAG: VOC family protein [Chloroflexi bacterium]|nr:VOC family protein [Chloroflexota bacterium]
MNGLYLDHVLIGARNLARTSEIFSLNLGFNLTPEGVHPGRGTHNRIIPFGSEYLELIAIRDASEPLARPSLEKFLSVREGLYMFALGTGDIDGAVARLRSRGVSAPTPAQGKRDGKPGYTWRYANLPPDALLGSETFLIQHDMPIEKRYPEPLDAAQHPNGVMGVESLGILVIDAETSAYAWQEKFGLDASPVEDLPQRGLRRVRLGLENCYLDLISPLRTGAMTRFLERTGEAPYLLSLKVGDLSDTVSALSERGVPTRNEVRDSDGASVLVYPADAGGVLLQFMQPAGHA